MRNLNQSINDGARDLLKAYNQVKGYCFADLKERRLPIHKKV